MAWSVNASGTQSATVGTEHTLATATSATKTYVLYVDTANLVAGEVVVFRVKTTVLSAGTERTVYSFTVADAQDDPIVFSVPTPGTGENLVFTLEQENGTSRNFPWKVLE